MVTLPHHNIARGPRGVAPSAQDRRRRSRPSTASPSSPPARIRPPSGAARGRAEGERYDAVMDDLQMIGQRNMLCGMHVHVELPDPDERVDVMIRMLPYLPLFMALSTSSPFWRSRPHRPQGLSARRL